MPSAYCALYSEVILDMIQMKQLMRVLDFSRVAFYLTRAEGLCLRGRGAGQHPPVNMVITLSGYCWNIKSLTLHSVLFWQFPAPQFNLMLAGLSQFRHLVSLNLNMCQFQNLQQLHRLLYSFIWLQNLAVTEDVPSSSGLVRGDILLPSSLYVPRPALNKLTITDGYSQSISILPWLQCTSTMHTLQSLCLGIPSQDNNEAACTTVQVFITAVGHSLKSLDLTGHFDDNTVSLTKILVRGIKSCTALISLKLVGLDLSEALSAVSQKCYLHTLELHVRKLNEQLWEGVYGALQKEPFSKLQKLLFYASHLNLDDSHTAKGEDNMQYSNMINALQSQGFPVVILNQNRMLQPLHSAVQTF